MGKDLTNSDIDRQNILNNKIALKEIQKATSINGIIFDGKLVFTKEMIAQFYDIDIRTIERYSSNFSEELSANGYEILRGNRLRKFLKSLDPEKLDGFGISRKTPQLAVYDFRAFLNIGMLLVESENARVLRQLILDIVIDTINQKSGGSTKYINHRDREFLGAFLQGNIYRKEFTNALRDFVDMGKFKYALYTDKIYQSIFKEKAAEYKEILKLKAADTVRDTFYSEILDLIASYECGLAVIIKKRFKELGRKLNVAEVDKIFFEFEQLPHWKPLIVSGRSKMASRDLALRDVFHNKLQEYLVPLDSSEYDRFLGDEAQKIEKLMEENSKILERLKQR